MIRIATLTMVLLCSVLITSLLQGCGDSGTAKAVGTYELDTAAMKTAMLAEIENTEDENEKMALGSMLGIIDATSMTITLNEDGTASVVMSGPMAVDDDEEHDSGTWTLTDQDISITMTSEGDDTSETITGTLEGDTIRLSSPDDEMPFDMVFNRRAS